MATPARGSEQVWPLPTTPLFRNLTGRTFGRWRVLRYAGKKSGNTSWLCECRCGVRSEVAAGALVSGRSVCCGTCARSKHGHSRRGQKTRVYLCWRNMITRCYNPRTKDYADYGGRGITVCDRWRRSFSDFLSDLGEPPSDKHTLERRDNDGNYCPGNVRWATPTEQARNTRRNRMITFAGKTQCLAAWAAGLGIDQATLSQRLKKWSLADALTTPKK